MEDVWNQLFFAIKVVFWYVITDVLTLHVHFDMGWNLDGNSRELRWMDKSRLFRMIQDQCIPQSLLTWRKPYQTRHLTFG